MVNNAGNIAVIGCGYWGKNLVRNFAAMGALRLVCDSRSDIRTSVERDYPGVTTTGAIDDVLRDEKVKGVVIATPAVTHYDIAAKALAAGKDVFVEKPLALSLDDGQKLVARAQESNRILMVGHLLRYHPAVTRLSEMVKTGELGRLQYLYSNRLNLGKFRTEENILWSFAPHDIDVLISLTGNAPETVSCSGGEYLNKGIADTTVTNLAFPGGVRAHIFVSWLHPYKEQRLVVVGDRAMAVFNDMEKEAKLTVYDQPVNWDNGVPTPQRNGCRTIALDDTEPLRLECRHFLDCIASRKQPLTDGTSALATLAVLNAAQESLENGGSVVKI